MLTPGTKLAARGRLTSGRATDRRFLLFVSNEQEAEDAEARAVEYARLFGVGPDDVRRRGTLPLVFQDPPKPSDRKLADECV